MNNMVFVVIGMFVLVWVVSAVMKAAQPTNTTPRPSNQQNNRNRQNDQSGPEKTTNSDLERFMAEIDKLRTKGDGPSSGSGKPANTPKPNPQRTSSSGSSTRAEQGKPRPERKANSGRRTAVPPPLPPKSAEVPVLRPVSPTAAEMGQVAQPAPSTGHTLAGFKQAKLARTAASGGGTERDTVTPLLKTIQDILKSKEAPAVAVILTEIFGEPKCRKKF